MTSQVAATSSVGPGGVAGQLEGLTVLMGKGIEGSVVAGIEHTKSDSEYQARAVDSTTGKGSASGDISFEETLSAMGKTLGRAMGISAERREQILPKGKAVQSALG